MRMMRWLAVMGAMLMMTGFTAGNVAAQFGKSPLTNDEELKLMALNGLREAEPAVAVPQIEKLLASDASMNLKKRALAILGDQDSPAAHEALGRVARGQSNPALQAEAIRQLGNSGRPDALTFLGEIYAASTNTEIKKSILRSYANADDKKRVLSVAKTEKDAALRMEAVRQLGNMDAVTELMDLYRTETSSEVKTQLLRSLSNCGATDSLGQILQTETSADLRQRIARELGNSNSAPASAILSTQYEKEKDAAVRKEILRAFSNQDNPKTLIALARKETDPDLRMYAVRLLSNMNSKEATDYLMEILNK
jgi:HEAT repeat protein